MSWKDNLLDASFRGVSIDVVGSELQGSRAIAQHGMPYRDGDTIEDLGREARRIELQAVFWGDNYEAPLRQLIAALDAGGDAELVHPVYGSITVQVDHYRVLDTAERPDYADVTMRLVEQGDEPQFFQRTFTTTADAIGDAKQLTGLAALIAKGKAVLSQVRSYASAVRGVLARVVGIVDTVRQATDGGWTGVLENVLGVPGITLQFAQLRSQILGTLGGLADLANGVAPTFDPVVGEGARQVMPEARAFIEAATPTDAARLLAGAAIPQTVPGSDVLPPAAVRAWQVALTCARQGLTPMLCCEGDDIDGTTMLVLPEGLPTNDPVADVALALMAYLVTEQALALADAVCAVLDAELDAPTLTPNDIDSLTAQTRSLTESAILMHRRLFGVEAALAAIEPLRQLGQVVQLAARAVINIKPPLIQRTAVSAMCLRQLAFLWYGDHARAPELLRLNPQLVTPYAIDAGVVLNAYAN